MLHFCYFLGILGRREKQFDYGIQHEVRSS